MMTIDLATIMHHNLPVKLFIFNNGGYLTIKQTQEAGFDSEYMGINNDSGISFPNFRGYRRSSSHKLSSRGGSNKLSEEGKECRYF